MTAERWREIENLLQAALERAPAERQAFLDQACAGDADLQREIESLLRFHPQAEEFLEAPPAELAAEMVDAEQQASPVGRMISRYRIERQIGEGGMGVVYLARDLELGRPAAVKLLSKRMTQARDRVRRFRQEARAASALNHPNILTIYEVGRIDGEYFIAAEFVAGQTLRAAINKGPARLADALDMTIQVAGALAAAHHAGITHRDIKPDNLMVRPDGIVKVLDFGLAKLSETRATEFDLGKTAEALHSAALSTHPGIVMGTVAYMSPEQARGLEVDARSDLFSLGVTLYELLTGQQPFKGKTTSDVLAALLEREPPPLAAIRPEAPAELQRIVRRALAKPIEERYQTAREMIDDLARLKHELAFATKLSGDSAVDEAGLIGKPARPSLDDRPASLTGEATPRNTSKLIFLIGYLRGRRLAVMALVAFVLMTVGAALAARWFGERDDAIKSAAVLQRDGAGRRDPISERDDAIKSVAVLPFVNVGNDPQMEYLPDGITESLIGSLSQNPVLRVMARSTVFTYKNREVDPRQVGEDLKVRAIVTGRVERQGVRLVIRAELVDAADGARLWGAEYQRPLADLGRVQEEIAREISAKLRLRLSGERQRQLAKRYTPDAEAYDLYLRGRHHYSQFSRAGLDKALGYFQQAIARDPQYALAYTGIADVYSELSSQHLAPSEALPRAKQAALKAVEINDQLAEAHHSLAFVKWFGDWDWAGAEAEFKRALELNPNAGSTYSFYADFLLGLKRYDESITLARRAEELDPLSAQIGVMVGRALFYLGQYDQSIAHCRKTLELDPRYIWAHTQIAHCFLRQGRYDEAIAELRRAQEINRHDTNLSFLGYVYAVSGRRAEARRALTELQTEARRRHVSPTYLARVYAGLGEKDRALALLRQAYEEHSEHVLYLSTTPFFDRLRSDPRFTEMLRGIGLAP